MPPVTLSIAGSDPSGGAGIQADLKTFHQHGCYGCAAVTLLTVQNTQRVTRVHMEEAALVTEQIDAVLEDMPVAAAKTGALGNAEIVEAVAGRAAHWDLRLVVDPVMISKHGAPLMEPGARDVLRRVLLPRATLITPNAPEAEALSGLEVRSRAGMVDACKAIADLGASAVLLKGGHLEGDAVDVLYADGALHEIPGPRVDTPHTHGVGCTLSAAITARLAQGFELKPAVALAKQWLTRAIETSPAVGKGIAGVNHLAEVPEAFSK